jgi:hypothetical protein
MSNQKSSLILLGVLDLGLIAGGFFWLFAGPQLFGLLLLILGVVALVWLWRMWTHLTKA